MPQIIELVDGVPAATNQGHMAFCSVLLVEGEDRDGTTRRLLVDTAHAGRRLMLVDALASRGLTPLDIDYVLCTHAHWDHMQNNDLFTQATLLIHPDERRYAHAPAVDDWATPSYTGYIVEQLEVEEVGDGHEVFPGVTVVDMRGHTVGSIGLSVETDRGLALTTSDAMHIASAATSEVNSLVFWDEDAASDTIRRIKKMADVIYPGHDAPFVITQDGQIEFQRTIELGIAGLVPSQIPLGAVFPASLMPGRAERTVADLHRDADHARLSRVGDLVRGAYSRGVAPVPSSQWEYR